MAFQPRFKGSIPSDLSVSLILTEGKPLKPITLEIKAGVPSPDLSSNSSQADFKENIINMIDLMRKLRELIPVHQILKKVGQA